jgi:hypothetical protein
LTSSFVESRESIFIAIKGTEKIQLEPEEGVTRLLHAYLTPPSPSLSLGNVVMAFGVDVDDDVEGFCLDKRSSLLQRVISITVSLSLLIKESDEEEEEEEEDIDDDDDDRDDDDN